MSFMFNPYPYADPNAVNPVVMPQKVADTLVKGIIPVAKKLVSLLKQDGVNTMGIDNYPGSDIASLVNIMKQQCMGLDFEFIDAASLLKSAEEITEMVAPYLPEDRDWDPVLLYGVRYMDGYKGLQDAAKVQALIEKLHSGKKIVVYGQGALAEEIQNEYDLRVWMDVTPRTAVLAYKYGSAHNIGATKDLSFNLAMRRNYYVDFETAMAQRWGMMKKGILDYYISADEPREMQMMSFAALVDLFEEINKRPFRCRPVYLEGVWGGWYIHKLRNLPKEMRNCAWVFDMIPLEVSLVAKTDSFEFEVPFFTLVQVMGEKLLGKQAFEQFGGYFPIRFNYDDTWHSSGNMSIQCHPDADFVVKNHREFGRQDESYYVCVASHGAKTYLGFNEPDSGEKFMQEAKRVEHNGELIDYEKYINAVPSIPGTQVMIPAGTVHASGRNQVILEIGSLTVGSYTYKLYDYQRIDPATGMPRPIHLKMGECVLHKERDKKYVYENLVNHGGVVREGEDWKEIVVGECDMLYFSLRNDVFARQIEDEASDRFHVLALVDGEKVRVESIEDPSRFFEMNYMDIIVVPAHFGKYRIINEGVGVVTVHKTMLRPDGK